MDEAERLWQLADDKDAFIDHYRSLPKEDQEKIKLMLKDAPMVGPQRGPQAMAFTSQADVTGYGGSAGGGKSALAILLAILSHHRTVIFRKEGKQLRALIDDMVKFVGTDDGLNRGNGVFHLPGKPGHMCEFGGIGNPGEEQNWKGRDHDLIVFEEATELQGAKVPYLMTWLRTPIKNQRCRVIMTFNPPGGPDDPSGGVGRWVIRYFAPWIDERYSGKRARSGEIRYFVPNPEAPDDICGKEVDSPEPITLKVQGEEYKYVPRSRTFIAARVSDNKYMMDTGYQQNLLALPEPWRSMMLSGAFSAGIMDHEFQIIKTSWVDEAMDRWLRAEKDGTLDEYRRSPMTAVGVDVACGGMDSTVIARRHGFFWDDLVKLPGAATPDGPTAAAAVIQHTRDAAYVCVDRMNVGRSCYDHLRPNMDSQLVGVAGQDKPKGLPGALQARNRRSELYLLLAIILDPANSFKPMLPNDERLRSDLVEPHYDIVGGLVVVEDKRKVKERLRSSPDAGDAVVYSLAQHDDLGDDFERLEGGRSEVNLALLNGRNPNGGRGSRNSWMSM